MVTPEEFDTLDQDKLQYNYSWIYDKQPKTEKEEKEVSEELMENIGEIITLEAFVPRYLNQAITFTGEDMGSDKAMMIILLYIVIVLWLLYSELLSVIRFAGKQGLSARSELPAIPGEN